MNYFYTLRNKHNGKIIKWSSTVWEGGELGAETEYTIGEHEEYPWLLKVRGAVERAREYSASRYACSYDRPIHDSTYRYDDWEVVELIVKEGGTE